MKMNIRLKIFLILLLSLFLTIDAWGAVAWPLRISGSGKYLEDQNGVPFLIVGDAAWSANVMLNRTNLTTYLNDRQAKGFTAILVNAIEHKFSTNPPADAYGNVPFTKGVNNWSVRNESYWSNLDYLINQAKTRGMLVILAPAYLGYGCGGEGWCVNMKNQTDAVMANYGTWIGNRYKNQGNVLWVNGCDAAAASYPPALNRVNAIANAIGATSPAYLQTAHSAPSRSAINDYNQPWLDINSTYSDYTNMAARVQIDYQRTGALPFLAIEGNYEYKSSCRPSPLCIQHQALTAYLGGALLGHIFGNEYVWGFGKGILQTYPWNGPYGIDSPGSWSMSHIAGLMRSRQWWKLIPDYSNTVVTSRKGSGASYKATARTSDGSTVMVWNPDNTSIPITVNMTKISGTTATAWSWNPNTNQSTLIGDYATTGSRTFSPGAGTVLVINGTCAPETTYTVTPSAGANGTIDPAIPQTIQSGSPTTFTVTPHSGYSASVAGTCGGSLDGTTYTTNDIIDDCTVIASFTHISHTPASSSTTGSGGEGNCFIATAVYGSYLDPRVQILRNFRDRYLVTNQTGQAFVQLYYAYSPSVATFLDQHDTLKIFARSTLTLIVYTIQFPYASASISLLLLSCVIIIARKKRISSR